MTDRPGVIMSASDVEAAIEWAGENPKSRWYVARMANAYGKGKLVPEEWGIEPIGTFREQRITSDEDLQRSAAIDKAVGAFADAVEGLRAGEFDQESAEAIVASVVGWSEQSGVLDDAVRCITQGGNTYVETGYIPRETMDALLAAGGKVVRHVRTQAGARRYGAPIGTPIVRDTKTGELKADKSAPKLDSGTRAAPNPTNPAAGDKIAKATKAVNTSAKDLEDGDEIIARDGRTHVITSVTPSGDSVKLTATDSEGKEHSYEVPGSSRVRAVRAEGERPNTDPSKVTERKNDDIEDVSREIERLESTGNATDKRAAIDLKAARTESKRKDTSSRIKPQPYKVPPAAPDREITRGRKSYEVSYKNKAGEPVTGQFWSLADGGRDAFVIPDGERRPIRVTVGEDGSISESASMQAAKGGRKMTDTALMDALLPNREEDSQLDLLDSEATPDAAPAKPEQATNPATAPGESVQDAPQSPRAAGIAAASEAVKAAQAKYDSAFYDANRLAQSGRSSGDEGLKARMAASKAERALAEAEVELANLEREFIGDTAWEARLRIAGSKIRRADEEIANQKAERQKKDQIDTGNRLQAAVQTARREFQAAVQEAKSVQESNVDPVASARARVAQLEAKGRIGRAVADFQQWEYETGKVSAAQYDEKRAAWTRTNMVHQEAMLDARRALASAEEADKGWQEPDVGGSPEIEAPPAGAPEVDAPETSDTVEAPEETTPEVPEEAVIPEASEAAPEEAAPEAEKPEPEATATPLDPEPAKADKPDLAPLEERVNLAPDLWENVGSDEISKDNHARFQAFTAEAERLQELSQTSESPVEAANARFQAHVFRTAARHEEDARIARLRMTGEFKGDVLVHSSDKRTQDKFDMEMRASLVEAARKASPDGELTPFTEPKDWYDEKNKPEEKAAPEKAAPKAEEPKAEPAKPTEPEKPSFETDDVVEVNGEKWRVYSSNEFGTLYVDRKNENGDTVRKRVDSSDAKMVRSVKEVREKKRAETVAKVREHLGMAEGQGAGKVEDEEVENLLKMTKARRKALFEDPDVYSDERLDDILVALSVRESEMSGGRAMWEVAEQKKISRALNDFRMARAERGRVAEVKEAETKKEGSTKVDGNGEPLEIFGVDGKGRRTRDIGERYLNSKGKLVTAQGGEEYFDLREEDMIYKLGNKGYQQWAIIKQFPNGDVQIASSDTHADRQRRMTSVSRVVHPSQLTRGDATGRQQQETENERRHRRGLVLQDANRRELDTSLEYEVTDGQSRGKRGKITSEYGDDLDSVFVEFEDGTSGHFPANMLAQVGKAKTPRKERQERIEALKTAPAAKSNSEAEENELDALFRDTDPDEVGGELVDGELKVNDRARALGTIDDAIEAAESNLDPELNRGAISDEDKTLYTERVKALKAVRARVAKMPEQTADSKGSDVPSVEELERLEAEYHRLYTDDTASEHLKPKARMDYMRAARARAKATGEPFRALEPVRSSSNMEPGQVVHNSATQPKSKPAEEKDQSEPPKGRGAAGAPDEYRPERIKNTGDVVLHHGGLPAGTTMDDIDVNRRGAQQGKRRRSFGGFYLTDESSRQWSTTYAASRDGNMHAFKISPDARIGEISDEGGSSNIDRISEEQRENMAKHFDVIKGKDVLGRTQYLLLNKSVVTEVEETNVNEPDRAPVVTRVGKSDAPKAETEPAEPKKAATTQADRAKAIEAAEAIQRAIANQFSAPRPERKPKAQTKADEAASASEAEYKLDTALEGRKDAAGNPIVNGARYRLGRGYQEWRVESVNRDGSLNLIPATGDSPLGKARNRKNVASNRLLPVTDAVPTSAAPIAATRSAATSADSTDLGDLKDATGNALYTEGRYNLGRGYQRWQVDSVNPDGTVNLLPTGGGDTTRKRWNVDPKKLKPVEGEGAPAPEAPKTPAVTQQDRRARIEAVEAETVQEVAPVVPTPKVEAPAKAPAEPVTAVQPPKGMNARVYRILIRTEENQLDELQAKVTAGTATRDDRATIAALEKNLSKLRGEEALYFPETPSPEPVSAPAPKPAPKPKRLTRKTDEWADLDDDTLNGLIAALDEEGDDDNSAGFSKTDAANLRNERAVRDQQNADSDRIIDLIANGGDPAEAEAEVTGESVDSIRRRMALEWLRDTYGGVPAVSGNRFEEVLASAYQFELSEEIVRAEATTNGNFFSREAASRMERRGQDASILWKGNERTARANASEELKAYWDAHGRLTKDEFRERVMEAIGRRAGGSRYTGADFHQ